MGAQPFPILSMAENDPLIRQLQEENRQLKAELSRRVSDSSSATSIEGLQTLLLRLDADGVIR